MQIAVISRQSADMVSEIFRKRKNYRFACLLCGQPEYTGGQIDVVPTQCRDVHQSLTGCQAESDEALPLTIRNHHDSLKLWQSECTLLSFMVLTAYWRHVLSHVIGQEVIFYR